MGWAQIIFGAVLVVVLLSVAILYIVRQVVALRRLRDAAEMSLEEHNYLIRRARRRLFTSVLMFLLGGMLFVDLMFLEVPAQQLADQQDEVQPNDNPPPLNEEQRSFAHIYGWFFVFFLVVLMIVVFMAALDYWATRRFALGQHRKIIDDRRAMIEREIARLRRERNGHS